MPEVWPHVSMSKFLKFIGGGTPRTKEPSYWGGSIPWYSVVDAPSNGIWVEWTEKSITERGLHESAAQLLPPGTVLISARGTVGKLAINAVPMAINQSCYGLRSDISPQGYWLYFAVEEAIRHLKQIAHGGVFDTITQSSFDAVYCSLPPATLTEAFEELVDPLMCRIRSLTDESRALSETRNTLLPRLMSGQISLDIAQA